LAPKNQAREFHQNELGVGVLGAVLKVSFSCAKRTKN
jgi:hypothetical protein